MIRFDRSRGIQLPAWLDRLISLGIVTTDPKLARRQRIVNVAAYTGAFGHFARFVSSFFHFADSPDFLLLQALSGGSAIAGLLIHRLHRFGDDAGAHATVVWLLTSVSLLTFMFGLQSQILSYFVLAGAILFVFGVNNWRAFLGWLAICCVAMIALLKNAPSAGIATQASPEALGITSLQTLLAAVAINTALIFYALFVLQRAEGDLERQSARAEALLNVVLPAPIAERLRDNPQRRIADRIEGATVLFGDLEEFTPAAREESPENIVAYLDGCVREFEVLCEKHGVEKIKTIGDAFMFVGGIYGDSGGQAIAIGQLALDLMAAQANRPPLGGHKLALRIGIHHGTAVGGVIGDTRVSYDLWGDAVNVASRMESHGVPGRIHVSRAFRETVGDTFVLEERGETEIKGIGVERTYFLVAAR